MFQNGYIHLGYAICNPAGKKMDQAPKILFISIYHGFVGSAL